MKHPFERSDPDRRRVLFGCLLYGIAVAMWGFYWLGPRHTSGTVNDLAGATTLTEVSGIVGGWSSHQTAIGRLAVSFDFLFILAHTTAIALACLWLTGHESWRWARRLGAWLAAAADLADVLENVSVLHPATGANDRG